MDDNFIKRLRILGEIAGSMSALARAAGISQSGIRKYLGGTEPTRLVLSALAKATSVRLEWLIDGVAPLCFPGSPLLVKAAQLIVQDFDRGERRGNFASFASLTDMRPVDAYAMLYKKGVNQAADQGLTKGGLPGWVRAVLPEIDDTDLAHWRGNRFNHIPSYFAHKAGGGSSRRDDDDDDEERKGWLNAPTELIVVVSTEIEKFFGDQHLNLERSKMAFILENSIKGLMSEYSGKNIIMKALPTPEIIRASIRMATHFYDHQFDSGDED